MEWPCHSRRHGPSQVRMLPAVMGAEVARPAPQERLQEANGKSPAPGKAIWGPWAFLAPGAWARVGGH